MPLSTRHPRLSWPRRLYALLAALWVVVQVSGVQQLCFCGSCEVSRVLAQWLPEALAPRAPEASADEHPCCAEARRTAERELAQHDHWSSEGDDCGCGERSHQWEAWTTAVDAPAGWQTQEIAIVQGQLAPALAQPALVMPADHALYSRGPPEPLGIELYLAQRRLLI